MSETSSPGDLTSRLRSGLEADRRRIEDDTAEATGKMRELLMKA